MTTTEIQFFNLIADRCALRVAKGEKFSREMAEQELRAELAWEEELAAAKTEKAKHAYDAMAKVLWTEIRIEAGIPC